VVAGAIVESAMEKQELVAAGNARRPATTSATIMAVTAIGSGTADNPGMGEQPYMAQAEEDGEPHYS
jgi:hypothetical protein